jgi:Protein of unknown function (DUF2917)
MHTMKRNPDATTMEMRSGQIERLYGATGVRLTCHRGTVWVTQEGLLRDDFLAAGNSLELVASGLTLIEGVGRAGASLSIETFRCSVVEDAADQPPRALV